MKKLKTLDEHNSIAWITFEAQVKANQPHPNGIACPNCGKELWDTNPMILLTSLPPQKNVHCPKCQYIGYRLA